MGKYFLQNTQHAIYERLMQGIPRFNLVYTNQNRIVYLRQLEKVILELDLEKARQRIEKAVRIYFGDSDDLFFRSYIHRKRFYSFYEKAKANKWTFIRKNHCAAALYLLLSDDFFTRFLPTILGKNQINPLKITLKETDEDIYDLYQAACFLCNGKDNLRHEDFTKPGILNERVMALIINAFIINKYGVNALMPCSGSKESDNCGRDCYCLV